MDTLEQLLTALPARFDGSVVLVRRAWYDRTVPKPELLSERYPGLRVIEARDGMRVESKTVYVPPEGKALVLNGDVLNTSEPGATDQRRWAYSPAGPVAETGREHAVALVLPPAGPLANASVARADTTAIGGDAQAQNGGEYGSLTDAESGEQQGTLTDRLRRMRALIEQQRASREQLQTTVRELAASREMVRAGELRFRAVLDSYPYCLMLYDADARIRYVNPCGLRATGMACEQLIGRSDRELYPESVWRDYQPVLEEAIRTREPRSCEWTRIAAGKAATSVAHYVPLVSEDGRMSEIMAITFDITEHKHLESQLRDLVTKHEDTNREMESFVYSVTHDLRTPLNTMNLFVSLLEDDHGEVLCDDGRAYLAHIRSGIQKMGKLIEDVLRLSGISRHQMECESTDVSMIGRAIVTELCETEPARAVSVDIQDAMVARVDASLIRVALANLLGNAWKYTCKVADPRIEFRCSQEGEEIVYSVRDNGAGFDMQEYERLFKPFERLHAERDFPGTGIGLAIVERVIRRHGGRVWAEGEPGRGAAFYFVLGDV